MRGFSLLLAALALSLSLARAAIEQDYLQIYLKLNDAERLEKSGNARGALDGFIDCLDKLNAIRNAHPDWQRVLMRSRLLDCRTKITELEPKIAASTSLASTGSSSAAPVQPVPPKIYDFTGVAHRQTQSYPWKNKITTTVFWIGENSRGKGGSAWDPNLLRDNGGQDDQYDMSGYASSNHASLLNPFYVALPFNDLAHPDLAAKWLPTAWSRKPPDAKPVSACKDRWIEIKNRGGRVCFAQWEDVGTASDDAPYVFGTGRPAAPSGLNISPAVAKYLGIDSSAITSWHFVDDEDVLPGMWMRYDEQAILFRAMYEDKSSH